MPHPRPTPVTLAREKEAIDSAALQHELPDGGKGRNIPYSVIVHCRVLPLPLTQLVLATVTDRLIQSGSSYVPLSLGHGIVLASHLAGEGCGGSL